jgi:hypothetical protein
MNFVYKKTENNSLDDNNDNIALQSINTLETENETNAIKECNARENCLGVYENKAIISNDSALLNDPNPIFIKTDTGYTLTKDKRFIYDGDDTLSYNSNEYTQKLNECYVNSKCFTTNALDINKPVSKLKNNFLHKENLDFLAGKNNDMKVQIVSNAQKNANTVLIIYKCKDKNAMTSLDLSNSIFYGIFYLESTSITLTELDLESGFYIARQIFYIESKENIESVYSVIFKNSQVATYVDNVFVKKTTLGITSEDFFVHEINLKLKSGVHCFINDFAFDTTKLQFSYNSKTLNLMFMPLIKINNIKTIPVENKSIDEFIYKLNPLLLTSLLSLDETYFANNCTGDNISNIFSNDRCKQLFKNPKFSDSLRFEIKKMFVDLNEESDNYMRYHTNMDSRIKNSNSSKNMDSFIEYLYSENNSGYDYETVKFIKERVESYFLNFFLNVDKLNESIEGGIEGVISMDINHILFLIPIISKCSDISCNILKSAVNSQVEKDCSLEGSTLFKSKICESLENTILNQKKSNDVNELVNIVKNIKDRRDFIYCTTYDVEKNEYNFEKVDSINRCEELVIKDKRLSDYLLSNKCTDFNGEWLGSNFCKEQSVNKRGIEKLQRDLYYKQILTSKERIVDVANNNEKESYDDFINYSTTHFLEDSNLDYLLSDELLEVCESSDATDKVNILCENVFSKVKSMNSDTIYLSNDDKENLISSIDKIKVSEKRKEVNKCSAGIDCSKMFNTDSVIDVVLYSGEVLKFCKNNPFTQECKEYYNKIQNLQTLQNTQNTQNTSVESLCNRIIIDNTYDNGYTLIFYLVLVLICVSLVVLFLNIDLTESKDIIQTNTETNTSSNINR